MNSYEPVKGRYYRKWGICYFLVWWWVTSKIASSVCVCGADTGTDAAPVSIFQGRRSGAQEPPYEAQWQGNPEGSAVSCFQWYVVGLITVGAGPEGGLALLTWPKTCQYITQSAADVGPHTHTLWNLQRYSCILLQKIIIILLNLSC